MSRRSALIVVPVILMLSHSNLARAHCQVPCGIYDDHNRVHRMREDVVTITKAMRQIQALAKRRDAQSANQLVRWVMTKEQHAEKIIRVISDYFMAQKITPAPAGDKKARAAYLKQLSRHHAVMVAAMKCKQTSDLKAVKALSKRLDGIAGYWPRK